MAREMMVRGLKTTLKNRESPGKSSRKILWTAARVKSTRGDGPPTACVCFVPAAVASGQERALSRTPWVATTIIPKGWEKPGSPKTQSYLPGRPPPRARRCRIAVGMDDGPTQKNHGETPYGKKAVVPRRDSKPLNDVVNLQQMMVE